MVSSGNAQTLPEHYLLSLVDLIVLAMHFNMADIPS
jgi:hypothetical protein